MSPEQAEGNIKAIGPRSDLYSLGVILYQLLTGRCPFEGPTAKVLGLIALVEPDPPSKYRPGIDPLLELICLKAMAKSPEDRFASMDEFVRNLTEFLVKSPVGLKEELTHAHRHDRPELLNATKSPNVTVFTAPPKVSESFIINPLEMKLKLVPAGEFLMGSPEDEMGANNDERPQHLVKITKAFYLGVHQVTQAEFQKVMGINPSWFSQAGGGKSKVARMDTSRFPVDSVSWLDAVNFCNKLSELEGLECYYTSRGQPMAPSTGYRLPTEAEWEYACRAGTVSAFAFGDRISSINANFDGSYSYNGSVKSSHLGRTTVVGSYQPNEFGLFDMHGNVWEWCQDGYSESWYSTSSVEDPINLQGSTARVYRGGAWDEIPQLCRSASRFCYMPDYHDSEVGFRVARCLPI
jgi:formylglycine-generating enzyme required for sulfatase activity